MRPNRLQHSEGGYLRSLQLSRVKLFVFVEGGLDRPFIERVLQRCVDDELFSVRAAKELPGGTGGKERLTQWYEELSSNGQLMSNRLGKKMAVLFVLDKDADDVLGISLNCDHVIYTPTYDIEGHLLSCGHVTRAIADAAGITRQQAGVVMPDFTKWATEIARHWVDWITLCLISHSNGVNCGYSFAKRMSTVNPDPFSLPDARALVEAQQLLQEKLSLSPEAFHAMYQECRATVEDTVATKGALHLFKGKWAASLLERHCKTYAVADAKWDALGSRVLSNLLGQLDVPDLCACQDPFMEPVRRAAHWVA